MKCPEVKQVIEMSQAGGDCGELGLVTDCYNLQLMNQGGWMIQFLKPIWKVRLYLNVKFEF